MDGPRVLTVAQARAYDAAAQAAGVPGIVLMEHAAGQLLEVLRERAGAAPLLVACGKGNNGGDGLVLARLWRAEGGRAEVVLAEPPERFQGDAAEAWRRLADPATEVFDGDVDAWTARCRGAGWLVDALLGTGFAGVPRPPYDALIRGLNASGRPILAVDVPSGFDADSGRAAGVAVRATATVAFVASKAGFLAPGAEEYTGAVLVRPILPAGHPAHVPAQAAAAATAPRASLP